MACRWVWIVMVVACGTPKAPQVVHLAPVIATSEPPPVHEPARHGLFPEDPTLDAFAPSNARFHQESWFVNANQEEHCREWGLLHDRKEDVTRAANALLTKRGIEGQLTGPSPETVRTPALVVVFYEEFMDGFFGAPGIDKLVVCSEGLGSHTAHEDFDIRLVRTRLMPDVASLGAPDGSWRREQKDHRLEVGLRWSNVDEAKVEAAFGPRGYVADPTNTTARTVPGQLLRTELRGTTLWWWGGQLP